MFGFKGRLDDPRWLYIGASTKQELLGFAKLEETPHDFFLAYLEIQQKARGHGISKRILSHLFDIAADGHKPILISPYTEMGLQRVHQTVETLKFQNPHILVEHEPSY